MSINFEDPMNDEARDKLKEIFSDKLVAMDEYTALVNQKEFVQQSMKELANRAKQPVEVEINNEGEIKVMSDGTRYQCTPRGWKKLPGD